MSDQKPPSEPMSLNSFQRILTRSPNILISAANPLDSCSRTTKMDVLSSPSPSQNRFILPKVGVGVTQLGVVEGLYTTEETADGDHPGLVFSVQSPDFILSPSPSSSEVRKTAVSRCCVCSTPRSGQDWQDGLADTTDLGTTFSEILVSVLGRDILDSLQVNPLLCQTCCGLISRIDKSRTQLERDCSHLKDVRQAAQQEVEEDLVGCEAEAVLSVVSSTNNLECRVLDISQGLVAAREARTKNFCCPVLASHQILRSESEEDSVRTVFYCSPGEWDSYNDQSNSLVSLCSGCMLGTNTRIVFSPVIMEGISAELEEPLPGPFLCADCDQNFPKMHLLISHLQQSHNNNQHTLDLSEVDFVPEESLANNNEDMRDLSCQRTGEEPSLDKPFQCESCDKCFSNYSNMMSHVEHYHGWSRQCNVEGCPEKLTSIATFVTHHVRHSPGQQDFLIPESNSERNSVQCQCPVCGKSSQGVNRHWEHSFIHDKIPRFKCPLCDRRVNKVQNLKDHIKRHLGPDSKTKQCELCDKKFCPADIYKHMKMVHGKQQDTKFHCNVCGKTFPLLHKLKEHNKVHLNKS